MKKSIKILLFPFYFVVMMPIEFGMWKAYKQHGKTTDNLILFVWKRIG